MTIYRAQGFVDGGYIRGCAPEAEEPGESIWPRPAELIRFAANTEHVDSWLRATQYPRVGGIHVQRTTYYDGRPDDDKDLDPRLREYWEAIELEPDTQLGFGMVRGKKRIRQKAVDTLLVTDLLVGVFTDLFEIAILLAGDQDFVPAVIEAKRRGVMVVVMAEERSLGDDLRRAADRVLLFTASTLFPEHRFK